MWVYQETPETAAAKALPEAIMPTAQEEPLKQKNRGVLPETAQEERRSIPAAFSERYGNTPERAAVRRSKPSEGIALLAAAAAGTGDDLICPGGKDGGGGRRAFNSGASRCARSALQNSQARL